MIANQATAVPEPSLDAKVRALGAAQLYDDGSARIERVETHYAWVFLTERYAYKLKKPIRADVLDHTTLAARQRACLEELRLNRRLAPEVYLDVVPLRFAAGAFSIGGAGVTVDWLVKMRRLASDLMLDRAIARGSVNAATLDAIANTLCRFYARQTCVELGEEEYIERLRAALDSNRRELFADDLHLSCDLVARLHARQCAALAALDVELRERAQDHRIVEGHGDLRPEHIFIGAPLCIIDALEFSFALRVHDAAEELAYLAVECEQLGAPQIGLGIAARYRARAHDRFSERLFDFYRSHRAATRAKIVAWHVRDPAFRTREPWTQIAESYLARALRDAERAVNPSGTGLRATHRHAGDE